MTISTKPNLQLIYVSDIKRSTAFYEKLFDAKPIVSMENYVAFSAGGDSVFSICIRLEHEPKYDAERFSEIGIMLPSNEDVDRFFEKCKNELNAKVVQEPITECFGRTFLIADPDGHIIRSCPVG
ncbi:glyoxalase [Candidatus Cytomitobacter indipagum]|uniref:Glyoxalase n=1 Tax=Candidatus Cytomitobacter indipagum TaxID=2601575 RepID=A0A5C0UDU2_9PROT|nr:VOC family protein [Candidatus Cytomitobacter indipagum]QEK38226.1 glyoxalase [Candidatus Cytomitobacter indipagum]